MNQIEKRKPKVYVNAMSCDKVIRSNDDFLTAVRITNGYQVSPLKIAPVLREGVLDVGHSTFVWVPRLVNIIIMFVTVEAAEFETTIKIISPTGQEADEVNTHRFPVKTGAGAE